MDSDGQMFIQKMRKKTICFFTGDITRCGGTERVSTIIANGLMQTGRYRIIVLSIVEQNDSTFFFILPKIGRYVLRESRKWMEPGPGYIMLIPALRRFLKKEKIDIVIDVDLVLDILSIPAVVGIPIKVISWEHFHYYFEQKFLYRRLIARFSARYSDYMITLTRQDKESYKKELHRNKKIDFIYNPIQSEGIEYLIDGEKEFGSSDSFREKSLITVGSLNERKGTDLIAYVVPQILCKYRDWKWYFCGDGEYRRVLEDVIQKYHLEKQLILTGNISNVEDYLKNASIFVMTSRLEGLPMCLLEAKFYRLPCISFDIQTGPSEIIQNDINGFLIPPFDLETMIEKITLLIENKDLRMLFSRNTTNRIEEFQLDSILQQWEKVLNNV